MRGGALAALREKEVALKAGIPGKDGVAFSERINMRDKLHQLEAARDYLADKCPDDLQDGYAIAAHNLSPVPFGAAKRAKESSYHCSDTASQKKLGKPQKRRGKRGGRRERGERRQSP